MIGAWAELSEVTNFEGIKGAIVSVICVNESKIHKINSIQYSGKVSDIFPTNKFLRSNRKM